MTESAIERLQRALAVQPGNEGLALLMALAADSARKGAAITALGTEITRLQLIVKMLTADRIDDAAEEGKTLQREIVDVQMAVEASDKKVDEAWKAFSATLSAS